MVLRLGRPFRKWRPNGDLSCRLSLKPWCIVHGARNLALCLDILQRFLAWLSYLWLWSFWCTWHIAFWHYQLFLPIVRRQVFRNHRFSTISVSFPKFRRSSTAQKMAGSLRLCLWANRSLIQVLLSVTLACCTSWPNPETGSSDAWCFWLALQSPRSLFRQCSDQRKTLVCEAQCFSGRNRIAHFSSKPRISLFPFPSCRLAYSCDRRFLWASQKVSSVCRSPPRPQINTGNSPESRRSWCSTWFLVTTLRCHLGLTASFL